MPINIDGSKGIRQNTAEVTKIPVGTTAQRPANPEAGMIRFNTDQGFVEWYDDVGDSWLPTSFSTGGVVATGGTVTDIEQGFERYRVHTFTSDGTFEVTRDGEVEYLVVAGGGSGGSDLGSGGGAGGLITGTQSLGNGQYPVVVGLGGSGDNGAGGDSVAFGLTAIGGGGGFDNFSNKNGNSGGSGSGAASSSSSTGFVTGGAALQPSSQSGGSGNKGGDIDGGASSEHRNGGAGGGGAGSAGVDRDPNLTNAMNGGDGLEVFGNFYAGGGAGAGLFIGGGVGGVGGGGDATQTGVNGTGGGGGGNFSNGSSTNGGSGIVIVRYRIG